MWEELEKIGPNISSCKPLSHWPSILRKAKKYRTNSPTTKYYSIPFIMVKMVKVSSTTGLPRCKNLTRFSLFRRLFFCCVLWFKMFCFLYFTSSVSFTGSYAGVKLPLPSFL